MIEAPDTQKPSKPSFRTPPMKDAIVNVLRDRIIDGTYRFGLRISDKLIADELQTSRTPVREALLQLRSEGLVEIRPQSGTFVFQPTSEEVAEICQARGQYESGAMQLVAREAAAALADDLRMVVDETEDALRTFDFAACERLDTRFHETIVMASHNKYLIESYVRLSGMVRALRHRLPQSVERVRRAVVQHRLIVSMVDDGKMVEASRELIEHVDGVNSMLRDEGSLEISSEMRDVQEGPRRVRR